MGLKRKEHPFVSRYKEVFRNIYNEMIFKKPNYIVAIARKGPRLVELFENTLELEPETTIISDRAIPYVNFNKEKQVPIFDDIVIYGSTMNDKIRELNEVGANPQPFSLCYNIDEAALKNDVNFGMALRKEQVSSFCDDVVNAFQILGKPYDIDHPIFSLHFSLEEFKDFQNKILQMRNDITYISDITSSLQKKIGIVNLVLGYSLPFALQSIFNSQTIKWIQSNLYKIRLYYNTQEKTVIITPICVFYISFLNKNGPVFIDNLDPLNAIIYKARKILETKQISQDKKEEIQFRLIYYIIEYIYGLFFISSYDLFPLRPNINRRDIYYLFGDEFGEYLIETLNTNETKIISNILYKDFDNIQNDNISLENTKLYEDLFYNHHIKYQEIRIRLVWSNEVNSLWNICKLMKVKDIITRYPNQILPDRLKFGFTFEDLLFIIKSRLDFINQKMLSTAIDYLVDRGSLLSVVLKYPTGYLVRAFRFGENLHYPEEKRAYFVYTGLKRLLDDLQQDFVSQFDFEKMFAFLVQILDRLGKAKSSINEEGINEFKELDLGITFDEFGARVITTGFRSVPSEQGRKMGHYEKRFLFLEALDNKAIRKTNGRISLDPDFHKVFPADSNPLTLLEQIIKLYVDMWKTIVYDRHIWPRKTEIELLLTTCNNSSNFLNSYKVGISSWFSHDQSRFSKCLTELKLLLNTKDPDEYNRRYQDINDLLRDNATRIRQSNDKRQVWDKGPKMIDNIEKALNGKEILEPLWQEVKNLVIDPSIGNIKFLPVELVHDYEYLQGFYEVSRASTILLQSMLKERVKGEFEKYKNQYNSAIKKAGFSNLQEITGSDPLNVVNILQNNYTIFNTYFQTLVKDHEREIIPLKEFDHDVSLLMYDLEDYSIEGETRRDYITKSIAERMSQYVIALKEEKYYKYVLDDENSYILSNVKNALSVLRRFIEILDKEKMKARISLHYTDSNQRIKYNEERPTITGSTPYIVCSRLRERARIIQYERAQNGVHQNVILITKNFYKEMPEKVRSILGLTPQLFEKEENAKGVGDIEYIEIDENKFIESFGPWKSIF